MLIIVGMLGQSIYAWGNRPENIRENNKLTYFEENFDLYGVRKGKDIDITGMIKFGSKASNWNTLPERFDIPLNKPWEVTLSREFQIDEIDGIVIQKDNEFVPVSITLSGKNKVIVEPLLEYKMDSKYSLKIFLNNLNRYIMDFHTIEEEVLYETGNKFVVRVPAMPEKGFKFPYYLAIPANTFKPENRNSKRYVMVDTTNVGAHSLNETERKVLNELEGWKSNVAEKLWTPMLMPVFPRTNVGYYDGTEYNMVYEHAFDRDIALLHKKLENPGLREMLTLEYKKKGFDVNDFLKLDEQLVAMFDHAVEYLNRYGHNVETDKMFLSGYSASGTFTDRFTALHPHKVKAVASGGTLDDMILPLDVYKNENLIFPIGTYDYKHITGRNFNLKDHNEVARLIYMGKDDDNNTVPYSDCYGDIERDIIIRLWGINVLPRAQALINLYGEAGGKGIFILDKGIGHGSSIEMDEYVVEFLKSNRDTDIPVYPIPKNKDQLEYKIYE